ncbi:hypothetical protein Tco_0351547, partial [Tanacetum coccineum]
MVLCSNKDRSALKELVYKSSNLSYDKLDNRSIKVYLVWEEKVKRVLLGSGRVDRGENGVSDLSEKNI